MMCCHSTGAIDIGRMPSRGKQLPIVIKLSVKRHELILRDLGWRRWWAKNPTSSLDSIVVRCQHFEFCWVKGGFAEFCRVLAHKEAVMCGVLVQAAKRAKSRVTSKVVASSSKAGKRPKGLQLKSFERTPQREAKGQQKCPGHLLAREDGRSLAQEPSVRPPTTAQSAATLQKQRQTTRY